MNQSSAKTTKKISPFVSKLLTILEDGKTNEGCIEWAASDSLMVTDSNQLSKNVLSKYFKHCNFSSFIRQLNIYGFEKIRTEGNCHYYRNANFIKGNRKKLKLIQRKPRSSLGSSSIEQKDSASYEPTKLQKKLSTQVKQLRQENDKLQIQNHKLKHQITNIKLDHEKQILKVADLLSQMATNLKQCQDAGSYNFYDPNCGHLEAIQSLKKQINLLKQKYKNGQQNFDRILELLQFSNNQHLKKLLTASKNSLEEPTKQDNIPNFQQDSLPQLCRFEDLDKPLINPEPQLQSQEMDDDCLDIIF